MVNRGIRRDLRQPPFPVLSNCANLSSPQGKSIMAEHSFLQIDLSIVFLLSVILIWFMIAFQLVLTIAGFFQYRSSLKEKREVDRLTFTFPRVTILIPAHNEEKVMAQTIEAMLQ